MASAKPMSHAASQLYCNTHQATGIVVCARFATQPVKRQHCANPCTADHLQIVRRWCFPWISWRKRNSCEADGQVDDLCQPAEVRGFHRRWYIRPKARVFAWDPGDSMVSIRDISTSEAEAVTGQRLQWSTSPQRAQVAGRCVWTRVPVALCIQVISLSVDCNGNCFKR